MGNTLRHALQGGKKPYDYTLVIGYKGEYPKEDGRRKSPIPVSAIAAMLNSGIIGKNSGGFKANTSWRTKKKSVGRPKIKKWDYENKVINEKVRGRNHLNSRIQKIMRDVISGKEKSAYWPLLSIGFDLQKSLKAKIWGMMTPKLAHKTIENREYRGAPYSEKPLIETQRLVDSIFVKVFRTDSVTSIQNGSNPRYVFEDIPTAKYDLGKRGLPEGGDNDSGLKTEYRGPNPFANFGTSHYHR
jgi:hypothetical protein